jgi:hypothetical protein
MDGEHIDNGIDVNDIVKVLAEKITELTVQNAVLIAQVKSLSKKD